MIAIIDYGAGNLQSVVKAFEFIGCRVKIIQNPEELQKADAAILPGVGSFGDAMNSLTARGFVAPIREFVRTGKPFLGICLGLQLLFGSSEESPGVEGLGILKGKSCGFPMRRDSKFLILAGILCNIREIPLCFFRAFLRARMCILSIPIIYRQKTPA